MTLSKNEKMDISSYLNEAYIFVVKAKSWKLYWIKKPTLKRKVLLNKETGKESVELILEFPISKSRGVNR